LIFEVKDKGYQVTSSRTNIAYLILDNWDDWYKYSTMYDLEIVDSLGKINYIGKIKIGEFSMEENQRRANIPEQFVKLDEKFFSLGQGDNYYENLKSLGAELRSKILTSLNDIALNDEIFEKAINEDVMSVSLLRDISHTTVKGQFRRIAKGGARLTKYNFNYKAPVDTEALSTPMELSFKVIPESNPPTNIHVIIGRNGVGKTRLIKNMMSALLKTDNTEEAGAFSDEIGGFSDTAKGKDLFANIICIAFSAFDEFSSIASVEEKDDKNIPYINIGLPLYTVEKETGKHIDRLSILANNFVESLEVCIHGAKSNLWEKAITTLESDIIFKEANVKSLKTLKNEEFKTNAYKLFDRLSSGHKIILLTITKLVQTVEEKSLIFLDEPEGHLHPPLLSAFVRALSELLINRNGVAIIATHSPVVLQEVPKSCVWKLRRSGREAIAERLDIESFGENIGALTREVFGFEVTYSGFHKLLKEAVDTYGDYDDIIDHFNGELGMEARGILKALLAVHKQEVGD